MNYWLIFLTGLTTGGLSCLAMQGGLLAGIIANQKEGEIRTRAKSLGGFDALDWLPVGLFLVSKLAIHIVLGFLLGLLGSAMELSLGVRIFFQILAALFMFATAMNLLEVHPIFRYMSFQPPKRIRQLVFKTSKSNTFFAPIVLGLLTVFVPCGVTQAMEVLVVQNGNAVQGALIMGAFVLGTMPLFATIGIATARLSEVWRASFMKIAAILLIGMALYGINGVLQVLDAPISAQKLVWAYQTLQKYESGITQTTAPVENGVQKVTIEITGDGYTPDYFVVKRGVPVELTLQSNGVYSCAVAFTFRAFNIKAFLKPTDTKTFTIVPKTAGKYGFSCSMGMYTGTMEVI